MEFYILHRNPDPGTVALLYCTLNENEERSKVSIQNPLVSPYLRDFQKNMSFFQAFFCPRCDASGADGQPIQRPGGDECAGSSTIDICIDRTWWKVPRGCGGGAGGDSGSEQTTETVSFPLSCSTVKY